jgi:hypothetical protein
MSDIYKVHRVINRWSRLSYDDRSQKFSSIYEMPIDDINIIFINDTYTKYNKTYFKKYKIYKNLVASRKEKLSVNFIINTILFTYPISIPMIEDIAKPDNIEIHINIRKLVYNISNENLYNKYVDDMKFNECKVYPEKYETQEESSNIHILRPIMFDVSIKAKRKVKIGEEQKFIHKIDTGGVNYDKEYDYTLFDDNMVYSDNIHYFHEIHNIISTNVFLNTRIINYQPAIQNFINDVINIKHEIIRSISSNIRSRSSIDNRLLNILDTGFDILSIFIMFFIKIYLMMISKVRDRIRINTEHDIYMKFRSEISKKKMDNYGYIRDYIIYVFSILYTKDYNLFETNGFKMNMLFNFIYSKYKDRDIDRIQKLVIDKNRIIMSNASRDLRDYNISRIFYEKKEIEVIRKITDYIDECNKSFKGKNMNCKTPFHINRLSYRKPKYVIGDIIDKYVYEKKIDKDILKKGIKREITKRLLGIPIKYIGAYEENKEYILSVVSKLRLYIDSSALLNYEKKILGIGFLGDKYNDEIKGMKKEDIKLLRFKYINLQKHFRKIMLKEWLVYHKQMKIYKDDLTLFKVLDDYIEDKETATTVYEFLEDFMWFYKNFDISKISVEKERMRIQELREFRINIYYNLTPEEKLTIDKFDFGSDEWNQEVDSRSEILIPDQNLESMEYTEYSDYKPWDEGDPDDEGWNTDSE